MGHISRLSVGAALCLAIVQNGYAQDTTPLVGQVYPAEETCAGGYSAKGCVLTIEITGKAAEILYKGMKAKAQRDECSGGFMKIDTGGLRCSKLDEGSYNCDVGYHFGKKDFGNSLVSC
jgi:hypothetical protein